jgi:hypothetical protein
MQQHTTDTIKYYFRLHNKFIRIMYQWQLHYNHLAITAITEETRNAFGKKISRK